MNCAAPSFFLLQINNKWMLHWRKAWTHRLHMNTYCTHTKYGTRKNKPCSDTFGCVCFLSILYVVICVQFATVSDTFHTHHIVTFVRSSVILFLQPEPCYFSLCWFATLFCLCFYIRDLAITVQNKILNDLSASSKIGFIRSNFIKENHKNVRLHMQDKSCYDSYVIPVQLAC